MSNLEKFLETFKVRSYNPSPYIYLWKRKDLDKLFDEMMKWDIAIKGGEIMTLDEELLTHLIPLRTGEIKIFEWKIEPKDGEEWYDYVERSAKETLNIIGNWDVDKVAHATHLDKLWYNFEFSEKI